MIEPIVFPPQETFFCIKKKTFCFCYNVNWRTKTIRISCNKCVQAMPYNYTRHQFRTIISCPGLSISQRATEAGGPRILLFWLNLFFFSNIQFGLFYVWPVSRPFGELSNLTYRLNQVGLCSLQFSVIEPSFVYDPLRHSINRFFTMKAG